MTATEATSQMDSLPAIDKSLPFGDDEAIAQAFEEDGFVVVTGILTSEQVQAALDELWSSPRLLGAFDPEDSSAWGSPSWPQQPGGRNFMSSSSVFHDEASWTLESNPNLVHTQRQLYGRHIDTPIMMQDLGRWGIMRPSAHRKEWRTESSWLHWDQNPWTQPNFWRLQAIVCLTDSTPTTGGFACVPGFHKQFAEWGRRNPQGSVVVNGKVVDDTYGAGQPFPVPPDDKCQAQMVKVLAPAGSAVIWDSRLPHQNFPNTHDKKFRVVAYTMMKPADDVESRQDRRRLLGQKRILMDLLGDEGPCFPHHLTPVGKQIHCLEESWPGPLEVALEEFGVDGNADGLREAAKLVLEAGKLEELGQTSGAIQKHRKSMALFPDIEEWHEAIFS